MKKLLISILIVLSTFFAINYNCNVFASSQTELDFSSYSQLNILDENTIFGIDKINNKIVKITNNQVETFGEYGNSDGQFTEIKFFKVLSNNELLVVDSLKRLQFFDTSFNHLKTVQYISNNSQLSLIGEIKSICCDIYANIYLLDSTNNQIIKANSQSTYAEIFEKNLDSSIEYISLNINGSLISASTTTLFFDSSSKTLQEEIDDIYVDALNYIYIKTTSSLFKYNINLNLENSIQLPENCTNLSLNLEKGIFYYLNSSTTNISKIINFASDVSNFAPPFNITENIAQNNKTNFARITKACYLYSTPYQISSDIHLTINTEFIILVENFDENLNFTYIMLEKNNKIITGYIKSDCYEILTNKNITQNAYPIRKDIPYYKLPLKSYSNASLKLGTLNFEQVYETTQKVTFNGLEYFEIKLNESFVFVECKNVLQDVNSYINVYFKPDCIVKPINNEKAVNIYSSPNKTDVLYITENPLNVRAIKKIDSTYEIQFLLDNEIKTGYVESSNLFENKNNFIIPIIIAIVLICLIIILIILFKFKKEFKRNI